MLVAIACENQKILVVGGGRVATRRTEQFLAAGARVTVVSPHISSRLQQLYKEKRIHWKGRRVRSSDLKQGWFLIALCINDFSRDRELVEMGRSRGLWISSALGGGTVRHVVNRDFRGWTIAVDTYGTDPEGAREFLERWLRKLQIQED